MFLKTKLLRAQMFLLRPIATQTGDIKTVRALQEESGKLIANHRVAFQQMMLNGVETCVATPPERRPERGILLYLHGGGYTAGKLEYAKGFGSTLAVRTGYPVLFPAYRLAPEAPYPAALEDAELAYRHLLTTGYPASKIVLCGESAGGGLCYALCLRLRDAGLPLPAGIIAISPWTDLTLSGDSYATNAEEDPLLTVEELAFDAACYAGGESLTNPYISPLYGDLTGLPPSLLFAGSAELLLDDMTAMFERLRAAGCQARRFIAPEMWHAYVLYGVEEAEPDFVRIGDFVRELFEES